MNMCIRTRGLGPRAAARAGHSATHMSHDSTLMLCAIAAREAAARARPVSARLTQRNELRALPLGLSLY
jgi:hypothetical protein